MSNFTNSTLLFEDSRVESKYVGFLLIIIAVIFWGLRSVPVKHFQTADGIFFQFFVCLGVWTISFIVNIIRDFPKFYALPMLSGVAWCSMSLI